MLVSSTARRRLSALAAAALLSVALPASAAFAQKTKTKSPPPTESSAPATASDLGISVDIPTIDAQGSNVDEATLRDILSGNLVANAEALAGLTAQSISIPTINLSIDMESEGSDEPLTITFNDLELTDIADGVAASVSLAGADMVVPDGTGELKAITAANVNIGGLLGLYGLVDAGQQTELQTIYTDFSFQGASIDADDGSCTVGAMTLAEFKARPFGTSWVEVMAAVETLESQDDEPDPALLGDVMRMYADIFTAFESSPAQFDGMSCDIVDDKGEPVAFSIGSISADAFKPGVYPAITISDLAVSVEGDGHVSIAEMGMKPWDLSGTIETLANAPETVDTAWLEANARALIPAFEGFYVTDVDVDVPDVDLPGSRVQATLGSFDLTLLDYLNGIPTNVSTTAENLVVDLPDDTADEQLAQLKALGITSIDAGFAFNASWNEAEDTIAINELSVTGADLATVILSGTIANATETLFDTDPDTSMLAAMALAVKSLTLDVTDEGLTDIILEAVAKDQGSNAATMRPVFAGLAEGTIIGMMAGAAEAQKVGTAVNNFISGTAKHLTIELTAKQDPGLGMADFAAAQENPNLLLGKVTINAKAE